MNPAAVVLLEITAGITAIWMTGVVVASWWETRAAKAAERAARAELELARRVAQRPGPVAHVGRRGGSW